MTSRRSLLLSLGALPWAGSVAEASVGDIVERPEWSSFFVQADAVGSIVVVDERAESPSAGAYGLTRASRRMTPASTFKIPHSLFALDAGLIKNEFDVIRWDGVSRSFEAWNRDQNLRSSMRNSVVWVYERFARQLGARREAAYMHAIGYGNALASGEQPFWVEGDLATSCLEQIDFLRRLYRNALPFRVEHQRLVKDVMIVEAGREWILRAKTGWSGKIGRWVGWIEWPSGPVFFTLNIDTPHRMQDLGKREAITRAVLASLKALPDPSQDD